MKPRTWAAIVGGALTIMVGGALVIAEDHEAHFSGDDATTTTVPVVIETTTTAAVETTTTIAPGRYGLVWHTGIKNTQYQTPGAIAVSDGLLYYREERDLRGARNNDPHIRVYPVKWIYSFDYYYDTQGGRIKIRTHHDIEAAAEIQLINVSDLAGLVTELEDALGS